MKNVSTMIPDQEFRRVCTAVTPAKHDGARYEHPDAVDVGECSEGCCDKYHCPHCDIVFTCGGAQ